MDSIVEDIKARIPVEDLLAEYIQIKKAGNSFKALCPFHSEKSPSLMISPEKGIWHCFGCNEGGDIFGFVMRMEGVEFSEALRILAKKAGVELRRQDPQSSSRKSRLLEINDAAAEFFQKSLRAPSGKIAQDYLQKRHVGDLAQEQFALGYSPDSWDALLLFLRTRGYKETEMEAAGLILARKNRSGYYDRFRNRLMFPLRDVHGQTLGFTARQLDPKEESAKYINSPETEIYHKGKFWYGLDSAKVSIKKMNYAILVEGQMDVIASHEGGVTNTIATSGTALTPEQLEILRRYTTNMILAFDMDNAGQAAIARGIDLALSAGFNIRVVKDMGGKDPDELVRSNPDLWRQAIKESISIMEFYFSRALKNADLTRVEDKKSVAKNLLPQIAKLQNDIEREHYIQKLANLLRVEPTVLTRSLSRQSVKVPQPRRAAPTQTLAPKPTQTPFELTKEQRLLVLTLEVPRAVDALLDSLKAENFENTEAQDLYKFLETFYNSTRQFELKDFLSWLTQKNPTLAHHVDIWMLALTRETSQFAQFDPAAEIAFLRATVSEEHIRNHMRRVELDLRAAEAANNKEKVLELTQEFQRMLDSLNKVMRK